MVTTVWQKRRSSLVSPVSSGPNRRAISFSCESPTRDSAIRRGETAGPLPDPHVFGAPGRRADIPGKFRTLQDYGDLVEIHLHTVFTFVTSAQRVQRRTASQKAVTSFPNGPRPRPRYRAPVPPARSCPFRRGYTP